MLPSFKTSWNPVCFRLSGPFYIGERESVHLKDYCDNVISAKWLAGEVRVGSARSGQADVESTRSLLLPLRPCLYSLHPLLSTFNFTSSTPHPDSCPHSLNQPATQQREREMVDLSYPVRRRNVLTMSFLALPFAVLGILSYIPIRSVTPWGMFFDLCHTCKIRTVDVTRSPRSSSMHFANPGGLWSGVARIDE
jgi:hypothetical protein